MANRQNKLRKGPRRSITTCPICDAEAIITNVPKEMADMLNILPGMKYVCSGKFIYRTNSQNLQLQQCYGLPVETAIKTLQLTDKSGEFAFNKKDVIEMFNNAAAQNNGYVRSVFNSDKFFSNIRKMTEEVEKL